jgi:hypothetical protein
MMSIKIYRHCDTWAFTDLSRGLQDEPFVCGIPEIIDYFIKNFSDPAKETHRIIFSAAPVVTTRVYIKKEGIAGRLRPLFYTLRHTVTITNCNCLFFILSTV